MVLRASPFAKPCSSFTIQHRSIEGDHGSLDGRGQFVRVRYRYICCAEREDSGPILCRQDQAEALNKPVEWSITCGSRVSPPWPHPTTTRSGMRARRIRAACRGGKTGSSAPSEPCYRSIAARCSCSTAARDRAPLAAASSSRLLAKTTRSINLSTAGFLMPMRLREPG